MMALSFKKSCGVACAMKDANDEDGIIRVHVIDHVTPMRKAAKIGGEAIPLGTHVGEVGE